MIRVRAKHTEPQEVDEVTDCILRADAHIAALNARRSVDNLIPRVFEIRWNWEGSLHGHYVPGTKFDFRLLPEGEDIRQSQMFPGGEDLPLFSGTPSKEM